MKNRKKNRAGRILLAFCMAMAVLSQSSWAKSLSKDSLLEGITLEPFVQTYGQERLSLPVMTPKVWDVRENGVKISIFSQGKDQTCWALSAVSALNLSWQMRYGESLPLSYEHIVQKNSFQVPASEGGDIVMLMAYLSSWQGPVIRDEKLQEEAAFHVQEMRLYENAPVWKLKEALREYGAVQTSIHLHAGQMEPEEQCYDPAWAAYYVPTRETPNHDIVIIGWDDTISRFCFAQIPPVDGAFLCMNSWGEEFGKKGLFYMSYADFLIGKQALVYSGLETVDHYDRIYQTDTCGWQGQQGYGDGTVYMANRYTAEENEVIMAVGFYAVGPETEYEISVMEDSQGLPVSEPQKVAAAGSLPEAGYYTIPLSEPVKIEAGKAFTVVVRVKTPECQYPAAVEYKADEYTQGVTLEGKQGYISHDGKNWEPTEEKFGSNVCLKVYTKSVS